MKQMTEKQAWLFIAKEFEKKRRTEFNHRGLCRAIDELDNFDRISLDVFVSMKDKIYRELDGLKPRLTLWRLLPSNKPKRAKLARQFAKECEG